MKPSKLVTPVVLVMNDEYFLPYALEASKGFFDRYVIYDVGSTDATREVIQNFITSYDEPTYFVRQMPMLPPSVQGVFRNSMIAEALTEFYFILDGDEVYSRDSYKAIIEAAEEMLPKYGLLYGVCNRIEVASDMESAYSPDKFIPHHRLYRRTAIWKGNHPGEVPFFEQNSKTEYRIEGATCFHFHNCARSSKDEEALRRIERRGRATYRPGNCVPYDVMSALPVLRKQFETPINPVLKELQAK